MIRGMRGDAPQILDPTQDGSLSRQCKPSPRRISGVGVPGVRMLMDATATRSPSPACPNLTSNTPNGNHWWTVKTILVQVARVRITGTRQGRLEPKQSSPNSVTAHFGTVRWIRMLDCDENLLRRTTKTGIVAPVVPLSPVLQGVNSNSVGRRMGNVSENAQVKRQSRGMSRWVPFPGT